MCVTSAVGITERAFDYSDKGLDTHCSQMNVIPPIAVAPKSFQQFAIISTELVKIKLFKPFKLALENSILLNTNARSFSTRIPVGRIGEITIPVGRIGEITIPVGRIGEITIPVGRIGEITIPVGGMER